MRDSPGPKIPFFFSTFLSLLRNLIEQTLREGIKEKIEFYEKTKSFKSQKKKRYPEYPGFEPGNSDPIANHITTRP